MSMNQDMIIDTACDSRDMNTVEQCGIRMRSYLVSLRNHDTIVNPLNAIQILSNFVITLIREGKCGIMIQYLVC